MGGRKRKYDFRPKGLKIKQRKFKQGKACACCGAHLPPEEMSVDHILPRTVGGRVYNPGNWQVLCIKCHSLKSQDEQKILSHRYDEVPDDHYKRFKGLRELRAIIKADEREEERE